MEACLFCKIIHREITTEKPFIYEDRQFVAIHDKFPKAPVHMLIIPKEHLPTIAHVEDKNNELLGSMLLLAKKIAEDQKLSDFKLVLNAGRHAEIKHLHIHLISGGHLKSIEI